MHTEIVSTILPEWIKFEVVVISNEVVLYLLISFENQQRIVILRNSSPENLHPRTFSVIIKMNERENAQNLSETVWSSNKEKFQINLNQE